METAHVPVHVFLATKKIASKILKIKKEYTLQESLSKSEYFDMLYEYSMIFFTKYKDLKKKIQPILDFENKL